jgi:hypothetical protein
MAERENAGRFRMNWFKKKEKPTIDEDYKAAMERIDKLNQDLQALPYNAEKHEVKVKGITKIKDKFRPECTFLIRMELRTGDHTEFKINVKEPFYKHLGGTYLIDESLKYYVLSSKCYALDYHQDCCLPIKRAINVKQINEAMKLSSSIECGSSTNPSTLDQFVESKIAEGVMKAQAVDEFLKTLKIMVIIVLIVSLIHFLLFIKASGILKNIKMPF